MNLEFAIKESNPVDTIITAAKARHRLLVREKKTINGHLSNIHKGTKWINVKLVVELIDGASYAVRRVRQDGTHEEPTLCRWNDADGWTNLLGHGLHPTRSGTVEVFA